MKSALFLFFSCVCLFACNAGPKDKQQASGKSETIADTGLYLYHFKNKYLDLNTLKLLDTIKDNKYTVVKREALYPSYFTENNDSIAYKNRSYKLLGDGDINIYENGKYVKVIPNTDKKLNLDNVTGNSLIFSTPTGMVHVLRLSEKYGYHIKKYDADGNLLNEWTVAHTLFKRTGNEVESIPYLFYLGHTNKEIVFSSLSIQDAYKTIVLNLQNGTQQKMNYRTIGMILDANYDSLLGVIQYEKDGKKLKVELNSKTWEIDNPEDDDGAKTVLKDSVLFVAMYPVISDGCNVNAYNANTGTLLWKGDVKQMMVPHSEYYNTVYLTLFRNKLILEGVEAGGQYLQVLDAKTGKRLFELMP